MNATAQKEHAETTDVVALEGDLLSPPTEIEAYKPFRAQLAEFKEQEGKLVFDYEDLKGNKEARSHVYKLRQSKSAIDKARLAETASLRDLKSRIDNEAKEIIEEIETMIDAHQVEIDAVEAREKARLRNINDQLLRMKEAARPDFDATPEQIAATLAEIQAIVIDASFGDMEERATQAKLDTIQTLGDHHSAALRREAERAEIEQLRKEKEARDQAEREAQAKRDAEEAEKQRIANEAKAAQEAADQRARDAEAAEKREKERAEQAEREAERRAEEAVEAERKRVAREAEEAAAAEAKREANKKHRAQIHAAVSVALVSAGISKQAADAVIEAVCSNAVPHLTINY